MIRAALIAIGLVPAAAAAHPHIFVDTGLELVTDDTGRLTHVRVTWAYDEYYSLLITEDLEVDQDFDQVLTEEDTRKLTGFDMQWMEGFEGDLYATLDGEALKLSGPGEATADLVEGRIVTTHLRAVTSRPLIGGHVLSIKPYDPTYYTAYEVTLPVTMSGLATCMIETVPPDIDARLAEMQQQLLRISPDADLEENDFPQVGEEFATDVRVSCPAS